MGVFLALSLGVWLAAGLMFASQVTKTPAAMPVMQQAGRIANTIVRFYALMLLSAAGLAAILAWNDGRRAETWAARPLLSGLGGVAVLGLALFLMVRVNINLVRADIYFKIGQGADARGDWQTAQIFYDQALKLTPNEDYYMLFQGRALLEMARQAKNPEQRKAFFQRAEEMLKRAQAANPLNTDHTANLARFYGTMAGYLSDPAERRIALNQAVEHYLKATQLSPNAAHLHNELGSVYAQLGEEEHARAQFQRSLELDPGYFDTYLRLGQLALDNEHWEAAYEAYQKAAELKPRDPRTYSGMAFALAKMGRTQEAIAMNKKVLELRPNDLSALQNLALLYDELGDDDQALRYANMALKVAPESQQPSIQALIQAIQQKQSP